MPDLSLDLQACYEYESFKKADGIEALVMGCPIPPLFRGIDFVAVVGSLSFAGFALLFAGFALLRQIRPLSKRKSRYICNFFAISNSLSPHAKQESDVSWQITCTFAP